MVAPRPPHDFEISVIDHAWKAWLWFAPHSGVTVASARPSPERALQQSPGRKPWVNGFSMTQALKGRHRIQCRPFRAPSPAFLYPGLTAWALLLRPFRAWN